MIRVEIEALGVFVTKVLVESAFLSRYDRRQYVGLWETFGEPIDDSLQGPLTLRYEDDCGELSYNKRTKNLVRLARKAAVTALIAVRRALGEAFVVDPTGNEMLFGLFLGNRFFVGPNVLAVLYHDAVK